MTTSAKVTGVLVGLVVTAGGVFTILRSTGALGRWVSSAAPCQSHADCESGCNEGHGPDCRQVGLSYFQGYGVARSPERAVHFLRAACDLGDAAGCTGLGAVLIEGGAGAMASQAKVRAIFTKACDGGDALGCNNLANTYVDGEVAERDLARARALYQKACDRGSGMGCSTLAKAYLNGDGVPQDRAQANRLFARSATILRGECDQGNARACGQVGWLAERGLGVEKDAARALRDYTSGCEGHDGASCYNLALTRRDAKANNPTVSGLFDKACQLGLLEACSAKPR